MAKITGAVVQRANGVPVLAHCHGNNAAISCPDCHHPILLIARPNQLGSDAAHPSNCQGCGAPFWMITPVGAGIAVNPVIIN